MRSLIVQEAFELGIIPFISIAVLIGIGLIWQILVNGKSYFNLIGNIINTTSIAAVIFIIRNSLYNKNFDQIKMTILSFVGFEISFSNSVIGTIFLSFVSIIWPLAYIYSWSYARYFNDVNTNKYLFFINLSISSAIIAGFSDNLFTLFIFYEILSLSTIPLVGHILTNDANKSLKTYLHYLLGCSVCFWLPAIIMLNYEIGSLTFKMGGYEFSNTNPQFLAILYLLCVFGIAKTAIIPLHSWLTSAMVAGFPVSAVLHAVAVVKIGIFALLKVTIEIFGNENLYNIDLLNTYLPILAGIGVLYAGFMATIQTEIKKLLAYSTISHLNIMLIAIFTFKISGTILAIKYMIIHSFTKITLFYTIGVLYSKYSIKKINDLRGTFKKEPLIAFIFVISALILSGLPVFYANITKYHILKHLIDHQKLLSFIMMGIGSGFTMIYMGKCVITMSYREENVTRKRNNIKIKLMKFVCMTTMILALNSQLFLKYLEFFIDKVGNL